MFTDSSNSSRGFILILRFTKTFLLTIQNDWGGKNPHKFICSFSEHDYNLQLICLRLCWGRHCHYFDPAILQESAWTGYSTECRLVDRCYKWSFLCRGRCRIFYLRLGVESMGKKSCNNHGQHSPYDFRRSDDRFCQCTYVHMFPICVWNWVRKSDPPVLFLFENLWRSVFNITQSAFLIVASVPVWVAELASSNIRGIMADIHAVSMMAGYACATYAGLGFYFVDGDNAWRGPMGLSFAWPFFILCGIYWLPESPRYLVAKGRVAEAWEVIKRMHANPTQDPQNKFAKLELYQVRKQIELDQTLPTSYMEILKQPSLRRRAWMTIMLELLIMSSGVLVILSTSLLLGFLLLLLHQLIFLLLSNIYSLIARQRVDHLERPRLFHYTNPKLTSRLPTLWFSFQCHRDDICGPN